ncbi:MAG TPA: PaaI family thioesterase [Candidatus Binatia bacterium]|jgi:uncharacterized protein (TIGR00369 family)|nr:PaaI family thioesterase [Candidatus Binatia bacterium]
MQPPGFWTLFGFEVEPADDDGVVVRMTAPDFLMSPFGAVHGGAIAFMFDTGLAVAVARRLDPNDRVATHNLNVSFVAFSNDPVLHCHARVVSLRTSVAIVEGEIVDASGTLIAKALGTFGVRRKTSAPQD